MTEMNFVQLWSVVTLVSILIALPMVVKNYLDDRKFQKSRLSQ
ncbi:MAG: hypothetical protein ACOYL6_17350 [Bacteriovoracaceae bacterium]